MFTFFFGGRMRFLRDFFKRTLGLVFCISLASLPCLGETNWKLRLSPQKTLNFGLVKTTDSKKLKVKVTNPSKINLRVTASLPSNAPFTFVSFCKTLLARNRSCFIEVTFSPSGPGVLKNTISIVSAPKNSKRTVTQTLILVGEGVRPPSPANLELEESPSSSTFRSKVSQSINKTFILRNTGESSATQISFNLSPGPFSLPIKPCASFLEAKASCTFSVSFQPVHVGIFTSMLTVRYLDNSHDKSLSLSLSGESFDPEPPRVVNVTLEDMNDVIAWGDIVYYLVEFDRPVVVGGKPVLRLYNRWDPELAQFDGFVSESKKIIKFRYDTSNGNAEGFSSHSLRPIENTSNPIDLNGGTIQNESGVDATLELPESPGMGSFWRNVQRFTFRERPTWSAFVVCGVEGIQPFVCNSLKRKGQDILVQVNFDDPLALNAENGTIKETFLLEAPEVRLKLNLKAVSIENQKRVEKEGVYATLVEKGKNYLRFKYTIAFGNESNSLSLLGMADSKKQLSFFDFPKGGTIRTRYGGQMHLGLPGKTASYERVYEAGKNDVYTLKNVNDNSRDPAPIEVRAPWPTIDALFGKIDDVTTRSNYLTWDARKGSVGFPEITRHFAFANDTVYFDLKVSEPVSVEGPIELQLDLDGKKRTAQFDGFLQPQIKVREKYEMLNILRFRYTVQDGDEAAVVKNDGYLALKVPNGSSVKNSDGEPFTPIFSWSFGDDWIKSGGTLSFLKNPEIHAISPNQYLSAGTFTISGKNFSKESFERIVIGISGMESSGVTPILPVDGKTCKLISSTQLDCFLNVDTSTFELPRSMGISVFSRAGQYSPVVVPVPISKSSGDEEPLLQYAFLRGDTLTARLLSGVRKKDFPIQVEPGFAVVPLNGAFKIQLSGSNTERITKVELVGLDKRIPCLNLVKGQNPTCDVGTLNLSEIGAYSVYVTGDENEEIHAPMGVHVVAPPRPIRATAYLLGLPVLDFGRNPFIQLTSNIVSTRGGEVIHVEGDFVKISTASHFYSVFVGGKPCESRDFSKVYNEYNQGKYETTFFGFEGRDSHHTICSMPRLAAGIHAVTMRDKLGGEGILSSAIQVLEDAQILSVSPQIAPVGSEVTLEVRNLHDISAAQLSVENGSAGEIEFCQKISVTQLKCKVPNPIWGKTFPADGVLGTISVNHRVIQPPSSHGVSIRIVPSISGDDKMLISKVEPNEGESGDSIVVTGQGFRNGMKLIYEESDFGMRSFPESACEIVSTVQLKCILPDLTPGKFGRIGLRFNVMDPNGIKSDSSGFGFVFLGLVPHKWFSLPDENAPEPLFEPTVLAVDRKLFVFGGYQYDSDQKPILYSEGKIFNPFRGLWENMSRDGAPHVYKPHALVNGKKVIIWGGFNADQTPVSQGAIYDVNQDTWTLIPSTELVPQVMGARVHSIGENLIVWGGTNHQGDIQSTGAMFNLESRTWSPISNQDAPSFFPLYSVVRGNRELIVVGEMGTGSSNLEGAIYDIAQGAWKSLPLPELTSLDIERGASFIGERLVVLGKGIYNFESQSWSPFAQENKPEFIQISGLYDHKENIIVTGVDSHRQRKVFYYSMKKQAWSEIGPIQWRDWSTNLGPQVVSLGNHIVFYGGISPFRIPSNSGIFYGPP